MTILAVPQKIELNKKLMLDIQYNDGKDKLEPEGLEGI